MLNELLVGLIFVGMVGLMVNSFEFVDLIHHVTSFSMTNLSGYVAHYRSSRIFRIQSLLLEVSPRKDSGCEKLWYLSCPTT